MKKLTLLFLSVALGVSVFGAEPKWKLGQEVMVMGVSLVVVGFLKSGEPRFMRGKMGDLNCLVAECTTSQVRRRIAAMKRKVAKGFPIIK